MMAGMMMIVVMMIARRGQPWEAIDGLLVTS